MTCKVMAHTYWFLKSEMFISLMNFSGKGCQSFSRKCLLNEHGKLLPIMSHIEFKGFQSVVHIRIGFKILPNIDGNPISFRLIIRR